MGRGGMPLAWEQRLRKVRWLVRGDSADSPLNPHSSCHVSVSSDLLPDVLALIMGDIKAIGFSPGMCVDSWDPQP